MLKITSKEDIESSKQHFGLNSKLEPPINSFLKIFWKQLSELMVNILLLFAFLNTAIGIFYQDFERGLTEGLCIFVSVLIVTLASSITKYRMVLLFR